MSCKKAILFLITLSLAFVSCQQRENIPDVSGIPVSVTINRFEQELFALDTADIENALAKLEAKYPEFSRVFFDDILGSTDSINAPEGHPAYVKGFIRYPTVRQLYDTTQIIFGDLSDFKKDLQQAFQFLKYYFPDQSAPSVTTFISEYSTGAFIYGNDQLAIGLDLFLGSDYPYLKYDPGNPNFSAYLTRTFNKEHLVMRTLKPLVQEMLGFPAGNRLLDLMIHRGKELYIMDKLLPYEPDSVLLEMTPPQIQWLEDNELEMWAFFLKENLLYNSNLQDIRKYVEYSPNSPGMPAEAPGRTASWLGWQIVKAYMKLHPETTLPELVALRDAQQLLDASKYRPKR